MTTAVSIFTMLAALAALITCFLTYRTTRPQIKIKLNKEEDHCFYASYEGHSLAMISLKAYNSSTISGFVEEFYIIYKGHKYFAEDIYTDFDYYPFEITNTLSNGIKRDIHHLRLKSPFKIEGFSIVEGFALFPTFPVIQANSICVEICFRLVHKKRVLRCKKVALTRLTPEYIKSNTNKNNNLD